MKTIHLIRHAKSSWQQPHLRDINRPLAQRGINDCKIMAAHLLAAGWNHHHIFCSQAQRAQLTIQGISQALNNCDIQWQVTADLYTFSSDVLLGWLCQLNNETDDVTLIGHNPGFTDLINQLTSADLDNLPTCAYAQMTANLTDWSNIKNGSFELQTFLKPKMFK